MSDHPFQTKWMKIIYKVLSTFRLTTYLENLEMSGISTAVSEISGILLQVGEVSGNKSCQGKVA